MSENGAFIQAPYNAIVCHQSGFSGDVFAQRIFIGTNVDSSEYRTMAHIASVNKPAIQPRHDRSSNCIVPSKSFIVMSYLECPVVSWDSVCALPDYYGASENLEM